MNGMASHEPHRAAFNLDAINRQTWKLPATVRVYERLEGWTDPGERAVLEHVAAEMRSRPILDMGVGAGRTTRVLREWTDDYVGIDYTEEMVEACRARFPDARILHMDARDLSEFEDNRFAMVFFSFNGIDAVDGNDRLKVLREVHRVLQPGGLFVFSAHNRNGPGHGEQPRLKFDFSWNPLKLGWRTLKLARSLPAALRNSRRYSALNETHDDWSIMNCAAHDFGIVIMYTTLAEQKRQLAATGLHTELVLDNVAGRPVSDDADTSGVFWFHYVARKPA
ncbi:MAG TPA: class I SAM-dependent methyltransferase [Ramlibacter sp.]|nr:class I SAM-dependent methyltransferase [Ramlibacter sp.]